tara:strand:+ start:695 stop:850 length:156 start_codon:yes stop_codon:yes gene_type:complete
MKEKRKNEKANSTITVVYSTDSVLIIFSSLSNIKNFDTSTSAPFSSGLLIL